MNESRFYSSFEDVKIEIQKRWQNEALKERVRDYLNGDIPEPFQCAPRAVLSRNIISPDHELMHFLKMAEDLGLEPLGLEGINDLFVTNNEDKMLLVKLRFFEGYDKKHNVISRTKTIVDIKDAQGKKLSEITTLWGENLVDFHHRILHKYMSKKIELYDDFQWFTDSGMKTSIGQYYKNFLALFVVHGVLFENFTDVGNEAQFTQDIFLPAFHEVTEKIGVSPLIIPAQPEDEVMDMYWWCYPSIVLEDINTINIK